MRAIAAAVVVIGAYRARQTLQIDYFGNDRPSKKYVGKTVDLTVQDSDNTDFQILLLITNKEGAIG